MSLSWDDYFIRMCYVIDDKSKDPSTQVGCVIVYPDNAICATGFNGFPRGVQDLPERYADREFKYPAICHGEENAILTAAKHGHKTDGCCLYVPWTPCSRCARMIIQSGVREIITDKNYEPSEELAMRWKKEHELAIMLFQEAGVIVRKSVS